MLGKSTLTLALLACLVANVGLRAQCLSGSAETTQSIGVPGGILG